MTSTADFVGRRAALLGAGGMTPVERRRALTDLADSWLTGLFDAAGGGSGLALVAIGGYGRRELLAGSDLDVLLLRQSAFGTAAQVAERVFYPVWNAGVPLDHSVRTVGEARTVAARDIRALLGLLDARHVAGERTLTDSLRSAVLGDWRRDARRRLGELSRLRRDRAARVGELAHLLEPELVEAAGGLRDALLLRAVAASWVADPPHDPAVEEAREWLLTVRDQLHVIAGRRRDRLHLDVQDEIAARLGCDDADDLLRKVSQAGRAIDYASEVTWRQVGRVIRGRPPTHRATRHPESGGPGVRRLVADGVAEHDGEIVLAPGARPDRDAVLGLRTAAVAAHARLALAPYTVRRLGRDSAPLPEPWPDEARHQLVSLLASGGGLVRVWEALDSANLVTRWLPEWERVRFLPQRTPVHRHTVDRHLVETVVQAARLTGRVSRPDLLLLAALSHDLGKGECGDDHCVAGAAIVAGLGARIGLPGPDVRVLERLVRHHLLLPEAATRRDPHDPQTAHSVAAAVGDVETLQLLAALTEADATAAGPAAWTPWRAQLVRDLVARVRTTLGEGQPPEPAPLEDWQLDLADRGEMAVVVEQDAAGPQARVTVVAPDEPRLLATVAGVLALNCLDVRGASVRTRGPMTVQIWRVVVRDHQKVSGSRLYDEVRRALSGRSDLTQRLAGRSAGLGRRDRALRLPPASVTVLTDASQTASVVQVRARDAPGLLYRLTSAIAASGATIRSAVAETLGVEAVDVFYLVDPAGRPLSDLAVEAVLTGVRASLNHGSGT